MRRNPSIELYRILAMMGICLLHGSIIHGHSPCARWINLWPWCVNAFVFISGYFGCSFKPSKVLRLYGTAMFSAFSVVLVNQFGDGLCDVGKGLVSVWPMVKGFWFLHAYVFLMVLAPCVDIALQRGGGRILLPICLAVFGWSFAQTLPLIGKYVPSTPGLESYSGMALLGTYAVARFYRLKDFEHTWKPRRVVLAFFILLVMSSSGLCEYDSPVAAGLACCGFYLVSRLRLCPRAVQLTHWVAPSMFAVYIVSVGGGWGVIRYCLHAVENISVVLASIVAGMVVFLFSLMVDLPRRALTAGMMRNPIERFLLHVDEIYDKIFHVFSALRG